MSAILREIDLHVAYLLLMLVILIAFLPPLPWLMIVLGVIPQGLILPRALGDFPKMQRAAGWYLLANEILVGLAVLLCLVFWNPIGRA